MDNVLNIGKGLDGKALYSKEGGKHKIRKQEMLNLGTKSPQYLCRQEKSEQMRVGLTFIA